MAESKNNIVVHGFSGKLGNLIVFRQKAGKTIVANKPRATGHPATSGQEAIREKFQQAVIYGKSVIADPAAKAAYEVVARGGQTAYNVAIADFFHAPEIQEIDVSGYTGAIGDSIKVKAVDDFKVTSVTLKIESDDGTLIEAGNAVPDPNGLDWIYTATATNTGLTGDKITVIATDTPSNHSEKDITL